jgi:hypothetical protein
LKAAAERAIQVCLVLVGIIHLAPFTGVVGSAQLGTLYGIPVDGPDLAILLRHRAVLFGIVGVLLVAGAVRASLRNTALVVGWTSVVSFLLLAVSIGGYNQRIGKVVAVDVGALLLLLVATLLQVSRHGKTGDHRAR